MQLINLKEELMLNNYKINVFMKTGFNLKFMPLFFLFVSNVSFSQVHTKQKELPHVLVIGVDGLGTHGIPMAKTPHMDDMMKNGAYSLKARTVMPSRSGPAWSSIITGATVERHGIGNNSWTIDSIVLEPVFAGDYNMFPTIFGEIRKHCPKAIIGAIYHWRDFGNFIEKDVCDLSIAASPEDTAIQKALKFMVEKKPNLTFVHLDLVDHAGHHGGYRSEEYVDAIEKTDYLIGKIIDELKKTGLYDKMVIFIVSDHGGIGNKHVGSTPDEMNVPFIIYGKGVKKGYEINHPVFNYDLAPTVAWLFGFQLNEWVSGKPLKDAFDK